MSIRYIAEKMGVNLRSSQDPHLATLEWLVREGNAAEGRTTLLALAFMDAARQQVGVPVFVFDHTSMGGAKRGAQLMIRAIRALTEPAQYGVCFKIDDVAQTVTYV